MKAVILAAGEGKRMRPITNDVPKPMIEILGKPLLEHTLSKLPEEIDGVILVVKYLSDSIREYFGEEYLGKPITYVEGSAEGTAFSFLAAREYIDPGERFLMTYGDEIINEIDIQNALKYPLSAVVFQSPKPETCGIVEVAENDQITSVIEKPKHPKSNLAVDGVLVLNADIFSYDSDDRLGGEVYFTSMLNQFVKEYDVTAVMAEDFLGDMTSPEDIARIEEALKERTEKS